MKNTPRVTMIWVRWSACSTGRITVIWMTAARDRAMVMAVAVQMSSPHTVSWNAM